MTMSFRVSIALLGAAATLALAGIAYAAHFSGWSPAQKIDEIGGNNSELNTPAAEGCPIQSPDGRSMYFASNRPGGKGGLDIWVASRSSVDAPFGAPTDLPEPINSAADDFCPTPVRGNGLFFVSRRAIAGVTCGLGDIYFARHNPAHGWSEPGHLGCAPGGPNTALDEMGPSYFEADGHHYLYYSSGPDIFVSEQLGSGSFGPSQPVAELNSPDNDIQPNVSKDGLEVVFSSNRSGGAGSQDIWASSRDQTTDAWSEPVNLGAAINTAVSESRPSLSWKAEQLLFGRSPGPEGGSDIYVSTRDRATGSGK